ncbi:PqqD family protein [Aquimarina sp. 2201CG14-23]|uniref:PqqD family protein n=1 Tax=Aquimarina mycalae TaxID=3040073 RepID=UPI002478145D|nr:PqqD family protein [Aquimarina sp. 2201CG14-23]MDH7445522.1 PqqD family protein [Aquimarina sp. 2201CG14-23]
MRYLINTPMVIADIMDDEIIILNMESGKYYSAMNTGAIAWQTLSNGYTIEEASEIISKHFAISNDLVLKDLNTISTQFLADGLIMTSEVKKPVINVDVSAYKTYTTPEITTYTDMEKLLLMDPVHEVENMGWPNKKEQKDTTK